MLEWERCADGVYIATAGDGTRYVVWKNGTLSGYGRTTYHESQKAAMAAAEHHDRDQMRIATSAPCGLWHL